MKAFIGTPSVLAEAFARVMHERLTALSQSSGAPEHMFVTWDEMPEPVRRVAIHASADTLRSFGLIPSGMLQTNN